MEALTAEINLENETAQRATWCYYQEIHEGRWAYDLSAIAVTKAQKSGEYVRVLWQLNDEPKVIYIPSFYYLEFQQQGGSLGGI